MPCRKWNKCQTFITMNAIKNALETVENMLDIMNAIPRTGNGYGAYEFMYKTS